VLPVVSGFFNFSPFFLLARVFVSFTQLYIHPFSFCSQSFHFFTGIPVSLVVGTYFSFSFFSMFFFFLSSIPLVSCTLTFYPFCPQALPLSFPLSISSYSSCTFPSLCNLAFLSPLLAPLSNIFLAVSLALLVPSIPLSLPRTSFSC
jgi:hypothetical protein